MDDKQISEAVEEKKRKMGASEKKADAKAKRWEARERRRRAEVRILMIDLFKKLLEKGITSECDLGGGETLVYHKYGKVTFRFDSVSVQFPKKLVSTKLAGA